MKKAQILIGLPGVGKSTYVNNLRQEYKEKNLPFEWEVVSVDQHIEKFAESRNTDYNSVFSLYIKTASNLFWSDIANKAKLGVNMIVDRTNMSRKSRERIIRGLLQNGYEVNAVVFVTPNHEEHQRRLNSRPGKDIPESVIASMAQNYQEPTHAEGFRVITFIE